MYNLIGKNPNSFGYQRRDKSFLRYRVQRKRTKGTMIMVFLQHMTGVSTKFISLTHVNGENVTFGESCKGKSISKGILGNLIIIDVSLVKELNYNLINKVGYVIKYSRSNLKKLNYTKCLVSITYESDLWHRKLGHISMKQISSCLLRN